MIFQWVLNTTSNLVKLYLSRNLLKGSTSNHFSFAMNLLQYLDLSYNVFKGEDLKSLCTLHSLYMSENNMTEDLPSILCGLSCGCVRYSLQELSLTSNQIMGSLPDLSVFLSLKTLDLYSNQLSGKILEGIKLPSHLEYLSIGSNFLEGGVPKSFGSTCTLELLELFENKLSKDLTVIFSHLSGCSRYSLQYLYLSTNQISDTLPNTISMFPSLKELSLDNNKLNGTISKDLRFPTEHEALYLMSNSLKV
ncbi:hypothetical protein VNO80_13041 [Phaseolus coccineus]|uniref:Non-specific serine/threonine protein kinase n=1 Tax=Phaseolus coccineus TaxID=3886 RepID=A0AAN9N0E5_PHACN